MKQTCSNKVEEKNTRSTEVLGVRERGVKSRISDRAHLNTVRCVDGGYSIWSSPGPLEARQHPAWNTIGDDASAQSNNLWLPMDPVWPVEDQEYLAFEHCYGGELQ